MLNGLNFSMLEIILRNTSELEKPTENILFHENHRES